MEIEEAIEFYNLMSKFEYFPSSPTMFNAGTNHSQLSSCYLVDSPADDLADIYRVYGDIAQLSKFAGGIGVAFHRVRSKNSKIKSTQGRSNGIVPFLKTLDASVNAVNQGGKRKGACCVYLEPWHDDIFEFLALKENTGDEARRTHNLNIANWIPDIFMERVENDGMWSLFSPQDVPEFPDLFGDDFTQAYVRAEAQGIAKRSVKARELFAAMMRTLAQTGNGWMGFKDTSNLKANQTLEKNNIIHHSNLCTEILEVTSAGETAVCNLGSINLARFTEDQTFQFAKLSTAVKKIVRYLDKTIDINFYPITTARTANEKWRPIGLGIMGLHELFLQLSLPFDSQEAKELSTKIQEEIYAAAIEASIELSQEFGPHPAFAQTRAAQGLLQPHLWGIKENPRFNELGAKAKEFGLRNSLLIAIAPTATIAAIAGTTECIEPLVANFFKRETLSGEFLQINKYLVKELRKLGLWKNDIKEKLKRDDGSIARIEEIPAGLKRLFRTAWEIPMRALIDMAAARGPFIDQSQSLNLFAENPDIGRLSSMYFYTWKAGLKTTYYLRSRAATKIMKTTVSSAEAKRCSLENPGHCEACQ